MVDVDGGDFVLEEIGDVPLRYLSVGDLYESFTDDDLQVAITPTEKKNETSKNLFIYSITMF
jgi:hypothetical protein